MSAPGALGLATCRASADSAGDSAGCNTPKPCTEPSWRGILTPERATLTGQMLLDENVASYNHAYAHHNDPYTAAPYTYQRPTHQSWSTAELLNALHAYRYNACERPEWATSEAAAFVDALQQRLISRIPGYTGGPWCIGPESLPAAAQARARA